MISGSNINTEDDPKAINNMLQDHLELKWVSSINSLFDFVLFSFTLDIYYSIQLLNYQLNGR